MMKYVKLEGIPALSSRLVYGTPGVVSAEFTEGVFECLDRAWEHGFRTFDTANGYGHAEENLGRWIEYSGHRDEMVILDKGLNVGMGGSGDQYSPETVRAQVNESLRRLRTDCLDLYILHRDDITKPIEPIVEVLNELKSEGKIRRFGGSNYLKYRVEAANEYAAAHGLTGFTALSPNYCLPRIIQDPWGCSVTISGEDMKPYREWLIENQMPVFNYSALGRGFVSGKYRTDGDQAITDCLARGPVLEYYAPENIDRLKRAEKMAQEKGCTVSQIALSWLLSQKLNLFPIVRPTGDAHMKDNIGALDIRLTEEEIRRLYQGE